MISKVVGTLFGVWQEIKRGLFEEYVLQVEKSQDDSPVQVGGWGRSLAFTPSPRPAIPNSEHFFCVKFHLDLLSQISQPNINQLNKKYTYKYP